MGLDIWKVRIDQIVARNGFRYKPIKVEKQDSMIQRAHEVTASVAEAINKRAVYPVDDWRVCSWCEYRPICWGKQWRDYLAEPSLAQKAAEEVMGDRIDRGEDIPF
jgi:hypothetical protein